MCVLIFQDHGQSSGACFYSQEHFDDEHSVRLVLVHRGTATEPTPEPSRNSRLSAGTPMPRSRLLAVGLLGYAKPAVWYVLMDPLMVKTSLIIYHVEQVR